METLTIGVIGCGQITESVHLPVLKALRGSIRWILDPNESQSAKVAKVFSSKSFPADIELSCLPDVQVVLIACPYGVRQSYYGKLRTDVLEAAIYVEKPIALTLKEHDAIGALRNDWMIAAGYNRRASANVRLARQLVYDGIFGTPKTVDFQYGGIGVTTGGNYRANVVLAGGGPLFETGVHGIDSINYILGAKSAEITDVKMEVDCEFDVHTEAGYIVKPDPSVASCSIPCSVLTTVLQQTRNTLRISFDTCTLEFSLFGGGVSLRSNRSQKAVVISESKFASRETIASSCLFWKDFIDAVRSNEVNYTNHSTSRLTTAIVQEIYRRGKGLSS